MEWIVALKWLLPGDKPHKKTAFELQITSHKLSFCLEHSLVGDMQQMAVRAAS